MYKYKKEVSIGEEIGNSVSHCVGAVFGIIALTLMLVKSNTNIEYFASIVFGISITLLYVMSTLYHAIVNPTAKSVMRRFDHLSIYILVAGSYTPFLLLAIDPKIGLPVLAIQWAMAAIGITLKSIWVKKYIWLHTIIFLIMGWMVILFPSEIYAFSQPAFWYLLAGGIAYSLGVIFFAWRGFKFNHMVWHFFVLLGTIMHFISIYGYIL